MKQQHIAAIVFIALVSLAVYPVMAANYMEGNNASNPLAYANMPITENIKKVTDANVDKNLKPHDKIVKIMDYVDKHISLKMGDYDSTPDNVLSHGYGVCGNTAILAAAMVATQGIPVKTIAMCESSGQYKGNTHVSIEAFYEGEWHFYDTTLSGYWTRNGKVVSFGDLKHGAARSSTFSNINQSRYDFAYDAYGGIPVYIRPEYYERSSPSGANTPSCPLSGTCQSGCGGDYDAEFIDTKNGSLLPVSMDKRTTKAEIKLKPELVSVDYNDIRDGITFTHDTRIDGNVVIPDYIKTESSTEIWMDGKQQESSNIIMKYDYSGNDSLKGTIIIRQPHEFAFRYSTNGMLVDYNGGLRIVPDNEQSRRTLNDLKGGGVPAGITIPAPTAVDADGKDVPVWYTWDKETIYLNIDDKNAKYPITIDPTYYLSAYTAYNTLLLHFNSTGVATDNSPYSQTLTNYGNVAANTTYKKFGDAAGFFNGGYLTHPTTAANNLGQSHTISMWVYPNSQPGYSFVYGTGVLGGQMGIWYNGGQAVLYEDSGAGTFDIAAGAVIGDCPAGQWSQIVVTKNATTLMGYVNGTLGSGFPITTSLTPVGTVSPWYIGTRETVLDGKFPGNIDDLAVWNGIGIPISQLYPQTYEIGADISPSTPVANFTGNQTLKSSYSMPVQFTDTSTGTPTTWNWTFGDGYTSTIQNPLHFYSVAGQYTVSLNVTNAYGFNSTTKTNYITLSSDNGEDLKAWLHFNNSATADLKGNVWTASDGAAFSTAQSRFGGGSLLIGSSDDRITTPSSAALNIANNFAIEFWIFPISVNKATNIVSRTNKDGTGTDTGWGLHNNGSASGYTFWMGNYAANATSTFAIPNGSWSHVAVQRINNNINISVNGTLVASKYQPGSYDTTNLLRIGSKGPGTEASFYMNEFRLSSTDRWNAWSTGFSTPYAQYNGIIGALVDQNPNSTLRYKTDPTAIAAIYNQTYGGVRNRTIQIQNATRLNNITISVNYDPYAALVKGVYANKTDYTDMSVQSYSIDNENGIINVKVNRTDENNPIVANLDTRINMVDFEMLYYNYTSSQNISTYFTSSTIGDNRTYVDYPVNNFIMTPVTYGEWGLYPNFSADVTTPAIGQTVTFTDATLGAINGFSLRNYSWGDGSFTSETWTTPTTAHSYSTAGTYSVSLATSLIENSSVTNTTTKVNYITVSAPAGSPVASFTYTPSSGYSPLNVSFTDTSTNTPTSWDWTFRNVTGNNTQISFSTSQNPNYIFGDGNYTIVLNATNSVGSGISSQVSWVNVSGVPVAPVSSFTYTPAEGQTPLAVSFTDTSLYLPTSWNWTFRNVTGNNTQVSFSTLQNPTQSFGIGNYTIALNSTNAQGSNISVQVSWVNVSAHILPVDLVASFTANPLIVTNNANVVFTDTSTGSPTTWNWSFGDTYTSTVQNPTHAYQKNGILQATLNVTNSTGSFSTASEMIAVQNPPVANFTGTPLTGDIPLNVQFNDTTDSSFNPTSWEWNFGDSALSQPWTPVSYSAQFPAFGSAASTVSDTGTMTLIAKDTTVGAGVWTSENGSVWDQVGGSFVAHNYNGGSVTMSDGSIILLGGSLNNDVWRSTDLGVTWNLQTANPGYGTLYAFGATVMPDNSIIIAGGQTTTTAVNETWRSTDLGVTWTRQTASAGFAPRAGPALFARPDGSVVIVGGSTFVADTGYQDVWRSSDNGITWTLVTATTSIGIRHRCGYTTLSDGTMILVNGATAPGYTVTSDVWASTNGGLTWVQRTATPGWSARYASMLVRTSTDMLVMSGGQALGNIQPGTYISNDSGYTWIQTSTYLPARSNLYMWGSGSNVVAGFGSPGYKDIWMNTATGLNAGSPWQKQNLFGTQLLENLVTMPNGDLVALGSTTTNAVWKSTDGGVSWIQQTEHAAWAVTARTGFQSLVVGNYIYVIGGNADGVLKNDIWVSSDEGATWGLLTGSSNWLPRYGHSSVYAGGVLYVMGGATVSGNVNDVWASTNNGVTFTQQTASAEWVARTGASLVSTSNGLMLLGGSNNYDVWSSTNYGGTWVQSQANAGWTGRTGQQAQYLPAGTVIMMGGLANGVAVNDVWELGSALSSNVQNPTHTYTEPGLYSVSQSAGNVFGNGTPFVRINYINVTQPTYYLTVRVVDTSFLPVPSAVLTDPINGGNYTANFNGVILYPFHYPQTITGIISADGYTSQTFSSFYASDANLTVQLSIPSPNPLQSTWYSPKQIAITVVSQYPAGVKIPNANINLRAIGSSLQADSQLQTVYGMNPEAANQIANGTLIMNTSTGTDGSATFTILSSIRYTANVTDPSTGRVWGAELHPGLDPYTIWIGDKPNSINTTQIDQLNETRLWSFKPDNGNWTMAMQYRDRTGRTNNVRFIVKAAGNLTEVYNISLGNPGINLVYADKTYKNNIGEGFYYYWVADRG